MVKTWGYTHILKSGNLAPQAGIRPPPECEYFRGYRRYFGGQLCDSARILKCTRTDTVQSMHPPNSLLSAFLVGLGFPGTHCVLIEPFKFAVSILYSVCSVWFPAGAFLRTAYPREYMPRELSVMLFFFRVFPFLHPFLTLRL